MDETCRTIIRDEIYEALPGAEVISCRGVLGEPSLLCVTDDSEVQFLFRDGEVTALDVTSRHTQDDFATIHTYGPRIARVPYSDPKMVDKLLEILDG